VFLERNGNATKIESKHSIYVSNQVQRGYNETRSTSGVEAINHDRLGPAGLQRMQTCMGNCPIYVKTPEENHKLAKISKFDEKREGQRARYNVLQRGSNMVQRGFNVVGGYHMWKITKDAP
jgi:hypothetical protein